MTGAFANEALLFNALGYVGHREAEGPASNPVILDLIRELFPHGTDDSRIAWCSAFANCVASNVCAENTLHLEHPGLARGWLKVGESVEMDQLLPGDIVVLWRGSPNSWKGHVGFFCNRIADRLYLLGGNQSNRVCIADYATARFLGGRRLRLQLT